MTDQQPTLEDFKDINLEQIIYDELVAELKKHNDKYLTDIIIHPEVYKYYTRKQYKKIKRRLHYDVWYWSKNGDFVTKVSKYFESATKARKYVNHIHNSGLVQEYDYVRMEKTWCYREHHPRHKWFYISEKPDTFICVEKY